MGTPLLTWLCIVLLMIVIVAVKAVTSIHRSNTRRFKVLDFGNEEDILFVPGDKMEADEKDSDDGGII